VNILGVSGSIGWDGNCNTPMEYGPFVDFWNVHGSGATLVMDGVLKNAINEERFSRIKYDGQYPKLSIQNILDYNNLTNDDIDVVVYVAGSPTVSLKLKDSGYIENKLQEYFSNCKVEFLSHHLAHASATYYTSGFDSANIFSFDGAGDHVWRNNRWRIPHFIFCQGEGLEIQELAAGYANDPDIFFGTLYGHFSEICYTSKMNSNKLENISGSLAYPDTTGMETYPGKVMGLAAFGDYQKIDLPDIFVLDTSDAFPQLHNNSLPDWLEKMNPDDLAAWLQHQFEKYLLLFLSNIPAHIKHDNLCLGGGCALNILANTKILEENIYKNVHVNTAPNDDGLSFGAALNMAVKYENKITLPDDIGYLGIQYTDKDIEKALC
jgi:carbamoyltransferase